MDYSSVGVDSEKEEVGLRGIRQWLNRTIRFRDGLVGAPVMKTKFYANILDLGNGLGLALSTDGVGTKVMVARMMNKYDTIGVDCIAMNVNDILCVGAEPIAFIDYLAVEEANPEIMEQLAKGMHDGAKIANVSVPGGETAQVPELLASDELPGMAFDLAGAAVGTVCLDKVISGRDIVPQDIVIGLASNGIHSNGLTLARNVLFEKGKLDVDSFVGELGRTVGEELLEPTLIYVPPVMDMLSSDIRVKGLAHITGDGLLNLTRLESDVSFIIESMPEPQPIFSLIQSLGSIADEEMFRVFNMGVGFCVIVTEEDATSVIDIGKKHNMGVHVIGHTVKGIGKEVHIKSRRLVGKARKFHRL